MEKAYPGQRQIPAKDWNEIRDFINRYTQQLGGMMNNPLNPFLVLVQNDTSDDLPAFSVVKLNDAIYPNRSTDDTKDAALNQLLEISGDTPAGEIGENIGILQEDIPAGQLGKAIVVGASVCYVQVDNANVAYKFAKSIGNHEKLKATNDSGQARIVWKEAGTGKKLAYVVLDQSGAGPEYFVINKGWNGSGTAPNTPSIFTAGSLHYITWDGSDWVPHSDNEASNPSSPIRPAGSKLVVCQQDAPADAVDYKMPYFAPESNMGVPPTITSTWSGLSGERAGVIPGQHTFTDEWVDYAVTNTRSFVYEPSFIDEFEAVGQTGGNQYLYIEIDNQQYNITYPNSNSFIGYANNSYPDIYPGDKIMVKFDAALGTGTVIDYPKDYPDGTVMPWYTPRLGTPLTSYLPGRGWQPYDPYQNSHGEITVERLDKNGNHYNAAGDCVYVEAGSNDKVAVKEGCLRFVEKIKTDAIT